MKSSEENRVGDDKTDDNLGRTDSEQAKRVCRVKNSRSKIIVASESLNVAKTPVLKPVNNILERHQRTRQLRNSTAKRLLQRAKSGGSANTRNGNTGSSGEKIGNVRKFVLPVRSVHSSRVIKPNKRFIEELEETCIPDNNDSTNDKQHKKARILTESRTNTLDVVDREMKRSKKGANSLGSNQLNSNRNKSSAGKTSSPNQDASNPQFNKSTNITPAKVLPDPSSNPTESSRVQTRSGTLSAAANSPSPRRDPEPSESLVQPADEDSSPTSSAGENVESEESINSQSIDTESNLSDSGSEHSDHSEDEQSEWTGMKMNGGKLILRKARLKLDNRTSGGAEGPFSNTNAHSNSSGSSNPGKKLTRSYKT